MTGVELKSVHGATIYKLGSGTSILEVSSGVVERKIPLALMGCTRETGNGKHWMPILSGDSD